MLKYSSRKFKRVDFSGDHYTISSDTLEYAVMSVGNSVQVIRRVVDSELGQSDIPDISYVRSDNFLDGVVYSYSQHKSTAQNE